MEERPLVKVVNLLQHPKPVLVFAHSARLRHQFLQIRDVRQLIKFEVAKNFIQQIVVRIETNHRQDRDHVLQKCAVPLLCAQTADDTHYVVVDLLPHVLALESQNVCVEVGQALQVEQLGLRIVDRLLQLLSEKLLRFLVVSDLVMDELDTN